MKPGCGQSSEGDWALRVQHHVNHIHTDDEAGKIAKQNPKKPLSPTPRIPQTSQPDNQTIHH